MNNLILANRLTAIYFQASKEINWLTLSLGIALLLALVILLIWLYIKGSLTQWFRAGIQSSKLKLRDMQLVNEVKKIERVKLTQIEELGQKAWNSKVSDPSYAQLWSDLEGTETQIDAIRQHCRGLQDNLNLVHAQKDELERGYDEQISQVDKELKTTEQQLKTAQSEMRQLENDLDNLANEKVLLQRDIKATRTDLINNEGSDEPDRAEIMGRLNARLDGLVQNLLEVSNAEPELASQIPARQSEVLALNARVNELVEQIRTLDNKKRNELQPLEQQLDGLEKQIKARNDEADKLEEGMEPKIKSLGHMVDTARPSAESLQADYVELDASYQKLVSLSQERNDLAKLLDGLDKSASRNFYLLLVLVVVVIVLAILLILNVF